MYLALPVLGKMRNKCFWLFQFWEKRKTNVFGFVENFSSEKRLFLIM